MLESTGKDKSLTLAKPYGASIKTVRGITLLRTVANDLRTKGCPKAWLAEMDERQSASDQEGTPASTTDNNTLVNFALMLFLLHMTPVFETALQNSTASQANTTFSA